MLLADALSRCPSRASGAIKLDMRVDYINFSKAWIAKLKETTREDPILGTVYQLTQQGWPHQRRHTPRSLVTRKASPVDLTVVRQSLIALQPQHPPKVK